MTENEKKIAKIFAFIALMTGKLKFYPIVCGFQSNIRAKLPNIVKINHRPRL